MLLEMLQSSPHIDHAYHQLLNACSQAPNTIAFMPQHPLQSKLTLTCWRRIFHTLLFLYSSDGNLFYPNNFRPGAMNMIYCTPYSNGLPERKVQTFKSALNKSTHSYKGNSIGIIHAALKGISCRRISLREILNKKQNTHVVIHHTKNKLRDCYQVPECPSC